MLKIVADTNIPFAGQAFEGLGAVELVPGRQIDRSCLHDCDALIVRSVTRIDDTLLSGTPVKFVGTATIGTDHVDLGFLQRQGIAFSSAAGSNANSVSEYVIAAILYDAANNRRRLDEMVLGVVGCGNVGRRVVQKACALGMQVLANDPPLDRQFRALQYSPSTYFAASSLSANVCRSLPQQFQPLAGLLNADVVTIHTPLTKTGGDPTWHLFDNAMLGRMSENALLINTARGAVVDNAALKNALADGSLRAAVLDVWENEPAIDLELMEATMLGTPHISGYSLDGKLNGTKAMFDAMCNFFQKKSTWPISSDALPGPESFVIEIPDDIEMIDEGGWASVSARIVQSCYDIGADDERMKAAMLAAKEDRVAATFDELRHRYPVRREFHNYTVRLPRGAPQSVREMIESLGFKLDRSEATGS